MNLELKKVIARCRSNAGRRCWVNNLICTRTCPMAPFANVGQKTCDLLESDNSSE